MALRPFHSGVAALGIAAVTLFFSRTLHGRAKIIFFSVKRNLRHFDNLKFFFIIYDRQKNKFQFLITYRSNILEVYWICNKMRRKRNFYIDFIQRHDHCELVED